MYCVYTKQNVEIRIVKIMLEYSEITIMSLNTTIYTEINRQHEAELSLFCLFFFISKNLFKTYKYHKHSLKKIIIVKMLLH